MTSFYVYSELSNHLVSLWFLQQLKIKSVELLLSRILWSWENSELCLEKDRKEPEKIVHDSPFHIFKLVHIIAFVIYILFARRIGRCILEAILMSIF